jgi:hypothetical protein
MADGNRGQEARRKSNSLGKIGKSGCSPSGANYGRKQSFSGSGASRLCVKRRVLKKRPLFIGEDVWAITPSEEHHGGSFLLGKVRK